VAITFIDNGGAVLITSLDFLQPVISTNNKKREGQTIECRKAFLDKKDVFIRMDFKGLR